MLDFVLGSGNRNTILNEYIRKTVNEFGQSLFACTLCDLKNLQKCNVMNHIESQHFPGTFVYMCEYCHKEFQSKNALNVHISRNHKK